MTGFLQYLSLKEVLDEVLDDDEPMAEGSDDDFEDIEEEIVTNEEGQENDEDLEDDTIRDTSNNIPVGDNTSHSPIEQSAMQHTTQSLSSSTVRQAPPSSTGTSNWSSTFSPITINSFSEPVGPKFQVCTSAVDVFSHFMTANLLKEIVDQTNLYTRQVMDPQRFSKWSQVSVEELKAFFGFNILMGLVSMPGIEDYWKLEEHFHYAPIVGRIPRDRFKGISTSVTTVHCLREGKGDTTG